MVKEGQTKRERIELHLIASLLLCMEAIVLNNLFKPEKTPTTAAFFPAKFIHIILREHIRQFSEWYKDLS